MKHKFTPLFPAGHLDKLGREHGTDKGSDQHDFLRKYEFFLKNWKNDAFTLLELGIFQGASIRTWEDYFPNAFIIGVDIDPETARGKGSRFNPIIADLGNIGVLAELQRSKPRLIIDDASHLWNHQILAFFTLFPHLEPGGIYILEDICTSFAPWAPMHRGSESMSPFRLMEILAEQITAQETTQDGAPLSPITPPGPYHAFIESIAKTVDCVAFIKFSCIIIKKTLPS